jgi:hypothetical protein
LGTSAGENLGYSQLGLILGFGMDLHMFGFPLLGGVGLRYNSTTIAGEGSSALGLDIGVLGRFSSPFGELRAALVIRELGPRSGLVILGCVRDPRGDPPGRWGIPNRSRPWGKLRKLQRGLRSPHPPAPFAHPPFWVRLKVLRNVFFLQPLPFWGEVFYSLWGICRVLPPMNSRTR